MKPELEDLLQHHGVKGMKWGKHVKQTLATHVNSVKREHSWGKQLANAGNKTTKELQRINSRAQLENDMKRLAKKNGVGSSKDKQDYLKRGNMSDQELFRKVQRLRAKDNLSRNASDATKAQREVAKKVIAIAAPIALQLALTKSVSKKDILNAIMNPGGAKAKAMKTVMDVAAKAAKNAKHSDNLEDNVLLGKEINDILQHHGTKGMHWGVRKRIQAVVKAHRARQNKQILAYHDKHKNKKLYKRLYQIQSKRHKTHLAAARKAQQQVKAIQTQRAKLAMGAATMAAPVIATHLAKGAQAVNKAVHNPDNIRRGKNLVQAIKRSPIRYVDGSKMKNVVN